MIQRFICFIKDVFGIPQLRKRKINTKCTIFRKRYDSITIECLLSNCTDNEDMCAYLYNKLSKIIIDDYKVKIFELDRCNMVSKDAVGTYLYYDDMSLEMQLEKTQNNFKKYDVLNLTGGEIIRITVPRIEILKLDDERPYHWKLFTLAHELGHHLIQLNGEEQSEELANFKILEVFRKYFDPIFIGIFHIMLNIKTDIEQKDIVPDFNKFYYDYYVNSPYVEKFNLKLLK